MDNKSIIIVGAGFTGAYVGRQLAERGWNVKIIEKRNHIAGNMYDKVDKKTGCLVHEFGPHIFHTDDDDIWKWLNKFSNFTPFSLKARVLFESQQDWFICSFGFHTVEKLFDKGKANKIIHELKVNYPNRSKVTIPELMRSDSKLIREFVEILWEEDYKPYTAKQWGLNPDEVDLDILSRVPVYLSYYDKIHSKKYEALPSSGYTSLFESILNHENIEIKLSTDAMKSIKIANNKIYYNNKPVKLMFTGAIDELFNYQFGQLNYRSLNFSKATTINDKNALIGDPCVDIYPSNNFSYTRITNYGKLPIQKHLDYQVSVKEYPVKFELNSNLERYYPLSTPEDKDIFNKYKVLSKDVTGLYLAGRLADYKYYDMDKALIAARNTLNKILEEI